MANNGNGETAALINSMAYKNSFKNQERQERQELSTYQQPQSISYAPVGQNNWSATAGDVAMRALGYAQENGRLTQLTSDLQREVNLRESVQEQLKQHQEDTKKQLRKQAEFLRTSMIEQFKERAEQFKAQTSSKLADVEKTLEDTLTALSAEQAKTKSLEEQVATLTKQLAESKAIDKTKLNDWRKNIPCRNGDACVKKKKCAFKHPLTSPSLKVEATTVVPSSRTITPPQNLLNTFPNDSDSDDNVTNELDYLFNF